VRARGLLASGSSINAKRPAVRLPARFTASIQRGRSGGLRIPAVGIFRELSGFCRIPALLGCLVPRGQGGASWSPASRSQGPALDVGQGHRISPAPFSVYLPSPVRLVVGHSGRPFPAQTPVGAHPAANGVRSAAEDQHGARNSACSGLSVRAIIASALATADCRIAFENLLDPDPFACRAPWFLFFSSASDGHRLSSYAGNDQPWVNRIKPFMLRTHRLWESAAQTVQREQETLRSVIDHVFSNRYKSRLNPNGIIWLPSALNFHGLLPEASHLAWVAVDRKAWRPTIEGLPVRIVQFSKYAIVRRMESVIRPYLEALA